MSNQCKELAKKRRVPVPCGAGAGRGGRRWSFIEKTAVVSAEYLDAQRAYPKPGKTDCKFIDRFLDAERRELIRINTVESLEGVAQFDIRPESFVEV